MINQLICILKIVNISPLRVRQLVVAICRHYRAPREQLRYCVKLLLGSPQSALLPAASIPL